MKLKRVVPTRINEAKESKPKRLFDFGDEELNKVSEESRANFDKVIKERTPDIKDLNEKLSKEELAQLKVAVLEEVENLIMEVEDNLCQRIKTKGYKPEWCEADGSANVVKACANARGKYLDAIVNSLFADAQEELDESITLEERLEKENFKYIVENKAYVFEVLGRRELGKLTEILKANNVKYTINRSKTEGYRYTVLTHNTLVESKEDDSIKHNPDENKVFAGVEEPKKELPVEDKKQEKPSIEESLKLISDISDYTPWSGAVDFYEEIVDAGKLEELEFILEDIYPDGLTMTELNDLLWFEQDWVREMIGLELEDNEEDDEDLEEDTNLGLINVDAEVNAEVNADDVEVAVGGMTGAI